MRELIDISCACGYVTQCMKEGRGSINFFGPLIGAKLLKLNFANFQTQHKCDSGAACQHQHLKTLIQLFFRHENFEATWQTGKCGKRQFLVHYFKTAVKCLYGCWKCQMWRTIQSRIGVLTLWVKVCVHEAYYKNVYHHKNNWYH